MRSPNEDIIYISNEDSTEHRLSFYNVNCSPFSSQLDIRGCVLEFSRALQIWRTSGVSNGNAESARAFLTINADIEAHKCPARYFMLPLRVSCPASCKNEDRVAIN